MKQRLQPYNELTYWRRHASCDPFHRFEAIESKIILMFDWFSEIDIVGRWIIIVEEFSMCIWWALSISQSVPRLISLFMLRNWRKKNYSLFGIVLQNAWEAIRCTDQSKNMKELYQLASIFYYSENWSIFEVITSISWIHRNRACHFQIHIHIYFALCWLGYYTDRSICVNESSCTSCECSGVYALR